MRIRSLAGALSCFNRFQSVFTSHVLLYHSTFRHVPEALTQNLHNVSPDVLFEHVQWLQKHFDIVELDTLFKDDVTLTGKVAITFDDAYQSVFEEAVPVIQSLGVPCTIFINGISLTGKPFWRDKIRPRSWRRPPSTISNKRLIYQRHCYSGTLTVLPDELPPRGWPIL